jgi:hypothetical protein
LATTIHAAPIITSEPPNTIVEPRSDSADPTPGPGAGPATIPPPEPPATSVPPTEPPPPAQVGTKVGDMAPEFAFRLTDGTDVSSMQLLASGRPVFMFYFATW